MSLALGGGMFSFARLRLASRRLTPDLVLRVMVSSSLSSSRPSIILSNIFSRLAMTHFLVHVSWYVLSIGTEVVPVLGRRT